MAFEVLMQDGAGICAMKRLREVPNMDSEDDRAQVGVGFIRIGEG